MLRAATAALGAWALSLAVPLPAEAASGRDAAAEGPAPGVARTPDAAFADLPGYPFAPSYVEVAGPDGTPIRMHYVDEGPRDGPVVVLLHGQPTWSYIWRDVIARLSAGGVRVIAPDLVGYGRSDKPMAREAYSYDAHLAWTRGFLDALALDAAPTLVVHDWGGLLGLRIAAETPDRFARLVVLDTSLNDGSDPEPEGFTEAFDLWIAYLRDAPEIAFGPIIQTHTARTLSPEEVAAYDAPYPDRSYEAGVRAMSALVPRRPGDPGAAGNARAREALAGWEKPVMILFSEGSETTHPGQHAMISDLFPERAQWRNEILGPARHFIPEDQSEAIAEAILAFLEAT